MANVRTRKILIISERREKKNSSESKILYRVRWRDSAHKEMTDWRGKKNNLVTNGCR